MPTAFISPTDITNILDTLSRRPLSRPLPNIVQLAGRIIDDVEEGSGMYGAVDPNGPEPMAEALVCLGHLWEAVGRPPIPTFSAFDSGPSSSQEYWLSVAAMSAWMLVQHVTAPGGARGHLSQILAGEAVAMALLSIAALWTGEKSLPGATAVAALPGLLFDLLPGHGAGKAAYSSVTP